MEDLYPEIEEATTLEELVETADAYEKADVATRSGLMLLYEENIRLLAGDQWTSFNGLAAGEGDGEWEGPVGAQLNASPVTQPRTNMLYPQVRALASMMVKNLPRGTARGKGDDASRVLARNVEKLIEVLDEENVESLKKLHWVLTAIVCGTGWKKNYVSWEVPLRAADPISFEGENLIGPDGQPDTIPLPEMEAVLRGEVFLPHEIVSDISANTQWSMQWIMERTLHPLEWFRTAYAGDEKDGYTGRADEVEEESDLSSPLNIWNRLKAVGPLWFGSYGATTDPKNAAVLKVLYVKPNKEFPGGLELHCANGIPLKVRGFKKGDRVPLLDTGFWHPYIPFGWFPQLGRFQSVSVVENLTSPQRRHNSISALRHLHRGTTVAPKLLAPVGSELNVDYISGMPGEIIEYNAAAADHPPSWMPSQSLSPDVTREYEQIPTEMKEIAGTNDPLSGDRAEGVPSYAGQALIMERASDAHMATHLSFEKAVEIDTCMQVAMISKLPELRESPRYQRLIREKLKMSGIEVEQIQLEDLSDSVVYRVEGGSSVPRSKVLFQQATMELVNMGAIDLADPEAHYEFLQQFGAERFHRDSHHIKKAEVENVQLMRGGQREALITPFDNGPIHIASHTKCLIENWFTLSDEGRLSIQQHIAEHENDERRKAMEAAQQGQGEQMLTPTGAPPVQSPMNAGPSVAAGRA